MPVKRTAFTWVALAARVLAGCGNGSGGSDGATDSTGRIWFDTSVAIEASRYTHLFGWNGVSPTSYTDCARWSRAALTDAELTRLANLRLEKLTDSCSADGYSSVTVTVFDAEGAHASYHEQSSNPTCGSNASPSPMLPQGSVSSLPTDKSEPCR